LTAVKDARHSTGNNEAMSDAAAFESNRRRARTAWLCLGGFAATAAIVATLLVLQVSRPARAADVTLIYVGAEDCAPCRVWQNGDGAAFRQSADFARIAYVEVKSSHLHDVLKDENWPAEIRSYRGRLKRSDGVPLWLVLSNSQVIEQRFGPAAWHANILPAIKSALRSARPPAG
jgi:hypothetical protein